METSTRPRHIDVAYIMIRDVLKNWVVILCVALSASLISYIFSAMYYTPMYTSSCTMVVSAKVNSTGAYTNAAETERLTNTIKAVFDSQVLKNKTAEKLDMDYFKGTVIVSVIPRTNLLEVSVRSRNPSTSFRLLKTLLSTYPEVSKDVLGEIVMEVFEEPNFPQYPSNGFRYKKTMNTTFVVAAVAVIAVMAIYYYLMETVKNEWDASDKLDAKLLGVLYHEAPYRNIKARLRRNKKRMLMGSPGVSFGFGETVKKIRTNLSYFQEKNGGNVLLVTSYDKREGKTTVASNMALSFSQRQQKVLLIPGEVDPKPLMDIFNIKPSEEFLAAEKDTFESMIYTREGTTLSLLLNAGDKAMQVSFSEPAVANLFKAFIDKAKQEYDIVIIDGPCAKISADTEFFARIADFSVLVVKQNGTKIPLINDTIDMLNRYNSGLAGSVLNDAYSSTSVINIGYGYGYGGYRSYGKYGAYGKYGKYGKYGSYGKYGAYGAYAKSSKEKGNKYGSYYQHGRFDSKREKK